MKRISLLIVVCFALVLPTLADTVWVAGNAFSFSLDKTSFSSGETATIHACTTVEVGANQALVFPEDRYMTIRFGAGGGSINGTPTVSVFPSLTYTGSLPGNVVASELEGDHMMVLTAVSKVQVEYEGEDARHFVTGDKLCINIDYTAPTVSVYTPVRVEEFNNLRYFSSSEISALTINVNP